ncbi:MAG: hypothetical protein KBC91_01640 [Candidatus Omnitrophica bacterium]|nr:hypothetical protein [Candidatus Omnitrophota bacterium]
MTDNKLELEQALQSIINQLAMPLTDQEKKDGWFIGLKQQFRDALTEYLNKIMSCDFTIEDEVLPNFTRGLGWDNVTTGDLANSILEVDKKLRKWQSK